MKALIIFAPLLAVGAWLAGAFGGAPALSEPERRARCAQLEDTIANHAFLEADNNSDDPTAFALERDVLRIDREMRRIGCRQFQNEQRVANRKARSAEEARQEAYEWGRQAQADR